VKVLRGGRFKGEDLGEGRFKGGRGLTLGEGVEVFKGELFRGGSGLTLGEAVEVFKGELFRGELFRGGSGLTLGEDEVLIECLKDKLERGATIPEISGDFLGDKGGSSTGFFEVFGVFGVFEVFEVNGKPPGKATLFSDKTLKDLAFCLCNFLSKRIKIISSFILYIFNFYFSKFSNFK